MNIFFILGITLIIISFIIRTNLLVYISNSLFLIRLSTQAAKIQISSMLLMILGLITSDYKYSDELGLWLIFFLLSIITHNLLLIPNRETELIGIDSLNHIYSTQLKNDPTILAIITKNISSENNKERVHLVPYNILRATELIVRDDESYPYSITFCLFCNTSHAYILPLIEDNFHSISSNYGLTINGNKALLTKNGKYIWQQLTGNSLKGNLDNPNLVELTTHKIGVDQISEYYPDAKLIKTKSNKTTYYFLSFVGLLVSKLEFFAFTRIKNNGKLTNKTIIIGVQFLGKGAKAYPKRDLNKSSPSIVEDSIDDLDFTLLTVNNHTIGFRETDLKIIENNLIKNELKWDFSGKSLGKHKDLASLFITQDIYWYIWLKFYTHTTIYEK